MPPSSATPAADLLSDLLGALQPRGARFWRTDWAAPWGLALPAGDAAYHVVLGGTCVLDAADAPPVVLGAGDLAVVPRGHAHALRDAPGTPALPLGAALDRNARATGPVAALVCGTVRFDATTHPLVAALPPVLVVRAAATRDVPWLDGTLAFLACEARRARPGADAVMGHLASVLFIQAVRAHLDTAAAEAAPGPLRALRDARLGAALGALHAAPDRPWTVADLAREAGMSRTAFAERFRAVVGEPPLAYATRWRMHRAATLLRPGPDGGRLSLGEVAARVGYESEAAFHRTFTRHAGTTPARFRRAA